MSPVIVIATTPQTGTIAWGPFKTHEAAEAFIFAGGHLPEIVARHETDTPGGLAVYTCPLYNPVDAMSFVEEDTVDGDSEDDDFDPEDN